MVQLEQVVGNEALKILLGLWNQQILPDEENVYSTP